MSNVSPASRTLCLVCLNNPFAGAHISCQHLWISCYFSKGMWSPSMGKVVSWLTGKAQEEMRVEGRRG